MPTTPPPPTIYRCRACGCASYQRLTHRAPDGKMAYSGLFRCNGCRMEFSDVDVWRERRMRPRIPEAGGEAG